MLRSKLSHWKFNNFIQYVLILILTVTQFMKSIIWFNPNYVCVSTVAIELILSAVQNMDNEVNEAIIL